MIMTHPYEPRSKSSCYKAEADAHPNADLSTHREIATYSLGFVALVIIGGLLLR